VSVPAASAPKGSEKYLTFFVGEDKFAATAADVAEIFRRPPLTRVPNAPPSLLGIAGLRGAPAPVISLARLLGREDQPGPASRLLLLAGRAPIGLAVDRVGAMAEIEAAPDSSGEGQVHGRLYLVEGSALRVLDLEALLGREFRAAQKTRAARVEGAAAGEAVQAERTFALLTFDLAGQAYALPLDDVAEVLVLPPEMAVIAQSDDAVLGVVNLREQLLPVVSTRRLLGLAPEHAQSDRVIVTRIGDVCVGLAVDRLRLILRAPESALDRAPAVLNRGEGQAQVESICRTASGLVAVLSAERLFRDEKVAQILADGRKEGASMDAQTHHADSAQRFLVFRIGPEEYGLPLDAVEEVASLPERLTRVLKAPPFVEGVMNLRGKVTPIIDQRVRFASDAGGGTGRPRVVVTTVEGRQAGFIVDAVSEILPLTEDQIESTPELTADAGRLFSRIATLDHGARLILLIEPKELLDRAERDLLAALETSGAAQDR
jgi:purine-binding chemotaxis protein CheW